MNNKTSIIFHNKIKNIEKAALIANIESEEIRADAIQACLAGASLIQLKTIVDQASKKEIQGLEKRGRQASQVHFGSTKNIEVAKLITQAVLKIPSLSHLHYKDHPIDWRNQRAIADTFRSIIKNLERLYI